MMSRAGTYGFALVFISMAAADATAQSTRTLRGRVLDTQGAAIPRATVDVGCSGEQRHVTTTAEGEFAVADLPGGRCTITAASDSFEPSTILADPGAGASTVLVLGVRRLASEVVVTPTLGIRQQTFELPDTISATSRREIERRPFNLLLQALNEEPGVMVQQTTSAQTSPVIRSFTGQSNVYLIDGIRFNNSAWRPGPSQYTAWVDPGAIDSIEIMRGTGAVQYGGDALGGTIQLLTAPPIVGTTRPVLGHVELAGASADRSVSAQASVGVRYRAASIRVGGSRQHVNDLRAGGGFDSHSAVTRFLGLPSTILGSHQRATSFNQAGAHVIGDVSLSGGALLHTMYMHDDQSGVSRYDRVLGGEGLYRSGFEPQTVDFGLARYTRMNVGPFDGGISAAFSVNRQADGRFEQSRPTSTLDRQSATTTAIGYQLRGHRTFTPRYQLTVGGEFYDEQIDASREIVALSGTATVARPDIPDGTTYTNFGVYAQQTADVILNRLTVRGGVRYSSFGFATRRDQALGVVEDDVTMRSATFQAAAIANVTDGTSVTASVTRGFRAANAGDLGSIGLTGGGGFEITPGRAAELGALVGSTAGTNAVSTGEAVPALKPEVVYQYDVGVKTRSGRVSGAVNIFDMELFDFIQRRALVFPTSVVGATISEFLVVRQDAAGLAYIAQDVRPIATRVNVDRARILGFDAEGEVRLNPAWTTTGYFSMANGRAQHGGEFIRRMNPPMGGAKLRWSNGRTWLDGVVSFAFEQNRLNSGDLSDARIGAVRTRTSIANFFNGTATDMGLVSGGILLATGETLAEVQHRVLGSATSAPLFTKHPGHVTVGVRAGRRLASGLDVTVLLENLGDTNYRVYGSGVDAPGFHAIVRTRYSF